MNKCPKGFRREAIRAFFYEARRNQQEGEKNEYENH